MADGPSWAPCYEVGVVNGGLVGQPAMDLIGEMDGESEARRLSRLMTDASMSAVTFLKMLFQVLTSLSLLLREKP